MEGKRGEEDGFGMVVVVVEDELEEGREDIDFLVRPIAESGRRRESKEGKSRGREEGAGAEKATGVAKGVMGRTGRKGGLRKEERIAVAGKKGRSCAIES
jgi:hypothetical protein